MTASTGVDGEIRRAEPRRTGAPGAGTLLALAALYLAQGLPFGFQAHGLPSYLRASGVDLPAIGLARALALPWMLKALWAPVVDRYGWDRLGRRRSWILPLQVALALACAAAAATPPARGLAPLLGLVLLMNLCAATQDIAVDGLAIDLLRRGQLGAANAAQVVGYKAGMLIGGGLLVWASAWIGWGGMFGVMGGLVLLGLGAALWIREPPREARGAREDEDPAAAEEARARSSVAAVLALTWGALRAPGAGWLLLFVGTYKLGESMVDAMFTPFLIDAGFTPADLGRIVGTWGMAASIAGSLAGGWLAHRLSLLGAVGMAALLRAGALGAQCYLAVAGSPSAGAVLGVTLAEHLFGGALTTAMFAFMMSRVRRSVGATHYTLLASVEAAGKSPGALASGVLAKHLGYAGLFALGTALSLGFLLLLLPLRRAGAAPEAPRQG